MARNSRRKLISLVALLALAAGVSFAQDAKTVIHNAEKTMGDPGSLQYSGTGKMGGLGQSYSPTGDWHTTTVTSYTRTIDYPSRSSKEELTRTQLNPPDRGGEVPFEGEQKQVNLVSGEYAWNQPGNAPQAALAAADERQLQIWLTPHGFLKAATGNNATAKTALAGGKKVTELSFMAGKHKVTGDIDDRNLVTKVDSWIPHPVLGDMLVETTYSDYKDFGGIKFPTHIAQKEGGHFTVDLSVTNARANVENASLQAPDAVRQATVPPMRVASQKIADGVWFLGGGTHNSVLVEFKDYVAVVEAPNDENRSNAVIAEVKTLVPNKPIKYLINTHHHFDHSGGIRTYVAEGANIITNEGNKALYEQAWKNPRTLDPDKLSRNPRAPIFITYKDKYVLTDGSRTIEIRRILGDNHNEFMSFAYLPKEKILIEADDFTPPPPNSPPLVPISLGFATNLYDVLQQMKIDVVTIVPLHGNVAPMSEMLKAVGKSGS
jgi:glyoxylase-like metal-dependent hydrolase (beta-lactamase superfamily II)